MDLEEQLRKKRAASLTSSQKVVLYSLRIFMGFVALGLIGAACYGIFVATDFSQVSTHGCLTQSGFNVGIV